jgi:hypothetical protein
LFALQRPRRLSVATINIHSIDVRIADGNDCANCDGLSDPAIQESRP